MKNDKQPPHSLTDVGLNMYVDTMKLSKLTLPLQEIDLTRLVWHFGMPVWSRDGTDDWNLTPQEAMDKKPGSTVHQKRIADADISYPIVVTEYKSRLVILDGVHRLAKVHMAGGRTIKAKIIPASYLSMSEFQT
ncbi:hypothetical protein EOL96_02030 [Candidatus Saccharibacteria bacterium]|nr:hypothetical protein [Candidatus Saccharibacteria bacterium]